MTYKIYADQWLLHDDSLENFKVGHPKAALEVNKTGSFEFSIYPDHVYYNRISKLKTIITVYQDEDIFFRGRVLDDEKGFYNEKQVTCEGELAFLLDSIKRPYEFQGSVEEFFTQLIEGHNAQVEAVKRFTVGNVTVTDPNDYIVRSNEDYISTWDELNKKLLDVLDGFVQVRHENGVNYIDYLHDFTKLSTQKVEFSRNLLDLKIISKGEDIATALIPLGAKIRNEDGTEKRLTVETVNNGLDYITNAAAVAEHGSIFKTMTWDDVTEPANLLTKGNAYLGSLVNFLDSVELTAADLAKIDKTVDSFKLGTYVEVKSKPHGIDQLFLVRKLSINLLDPAANKLTLGGTLQGFGDTVKGLSDGQGVILGAVEKVAETVNSAVYDFETNMAASIGLSAEGILQTVSEKYFLKDAAESLLSEVTSSMEHTASGFEMQFTTFNKDLEDLTNGTDAEFELIKKYIRFVDGSILLGQVGNELELQISNDRISFLQGNSEVAYFSNAKLYVTDGEYTNSLQLGKFAFIPRDNGNLSFKKVVD